MAIEAIIFDLDGVIFDSEELHKIAWKMVFKRHNIKITEDDYVKGIGVSDIDFLKGLVQQKKIPDDIDGFLSEKRKTLLEMSSQAKTFDGITDFIKDVYSYYKLAVASNSDRNFVLKLLDSSKLTGFFSVILGFQDISKPKPDPEIYIRCAEKLNVKNSNCVVIEDSPAGIKAAKSAGMKCIGITTMLDEKALSQADFIVSKDNIKSIKNFLSRF